MLDMYDGPRPRRRGRLRRALPSVVCLLGAIVLMSLIGDADVDQGNLWAIGALALVWTAISIPVWRTDPNDYVSQAWRFRRLHIRLHLCLTTLLIYGSIAMFWFASYAHFEESDEYGTTDSATDWAHFSSYDHWSLVLLIAAAVPLVVWPLTWFLWPIQVRTALRDARASSRSGGTTTRW